MLYRYLHLSFTPPSYDTITTGVPPTLRYLRTEIFDRSGDESLPDWVTRVPRRPTINVTLGLAMFNRTPGVFHAILDGLAEEDINVIATIGRGNSVAALGPQADNVRVVQYIPQSLLFPHCDMVVTHGGWTSTMAALAHGLPQVVVPIGADQPMNALRIATLQAGRVVPLPELAPESVRAAVRDVLEEPRYRANARRLQAEMATLPGIEHAVDLLERLAAGRGD
jgi:MGT family glycosyltransferase